MPGGGRIELQSQQGNSSRPILHQHHIVKSGLITDLRKIIATLGLPHEQFADHSFKIGAATKAAVAGSSHS